ncbi:MAG: GNAT family N-acetyltransferase [Candidatus Microsaccharimonas sp.]
MAHGHQLEEVTAPTLQTETFVKRRHEVAELLRQSFAGAPWFEDLSEQEALARTESYIQKPGFEAILALGKSGVIAAGLWCDTPSLDQLSAERGADLADFAAITLDREGAEGIVWEREVVVSPNFQGRGLATQLRGEFLRTVATSTARSALMLTRMRDDNAAIITVAEKFDYERTGIRMPSSQNPDVSHEYWYKVVRNNE